MAYASAGLISATDYNNLAWGGTQGTYTAVTKNIAYVMGVGTGAVGYGQTITAINTVSAAGTVTAVQWSGMLTLLNNALAHQSGAGAVLGGNYTAGQTITYFANVNTAVTTINTNAALFNAQGATTTGANFDDAISTAAGLSAAVYGLRTVTFQSADQARLFFNAGGQLNYVVSTPTTAGSGSQQSFERLIAALGGFGQKNTTSTGRTGTGLTLGTNSLTAGYRNNTTSFVSAVAVTDTTTAYTTDTGAIQVRTSSTDVTNGANGLNIIFQCLYTIPNKSFDDQITLTHRTRVDIIKPEISYLTDVWGTITIT